METSGTFHAPRLICYIRNARKIGYKNNFKLTEMGLQMAGCKDLFGPSYITIKDIQVFQISTEHSENVILYLIETKDGQKGLLINASGPFANPILASFIGEVEMNA